MVGTTTQASRASTASATIRVSAADERHARFGPSDRTTWNASRVEDATRTNALRPTGGRWGRATLLFHVALFVVAVVAAWEWNVNSTLWLPLIALPTTCAAGVVMLFFRGWRRVGAHVTVASVLAAATEAALVVAIVLVYAQQNPGWDFS